MVRKVPGNLRSQEFVFFSCADFLPPIDVSCQDIAMQAHAADAAAGGVECSVPKASEMVAEGGSTGFSREETSSWLHRPRLKPKGDGGKGTGKQKKMSRQFATKNVTTIYDKRHDNLRHFI